MVFCGGLAFFCSFIDRLSWPPVIPLAAKELGLSGAQAGGFMSAFFFGYLLTQLPGGLLADRLGTRKVLLYSLVLMGLFTLGMNWVFDFYSGMFLRFFAGLGSGGVLAAAIKGVYDYFPQKQRATGMGFLMASGPMGLMTANLTAPALAGLYGWRVSFIAAGICTLLAFFFAWRLPSSCKIIYNKGVIENNPSHWDFLRNTNVLLAAIAGFFAMWGTWGTLTWANVYMHKVLGLSLIKSGQGMAIFAVGALVGQPVAGWISDQLANYRRQVSMVIFILFSLSLWLFGNNQNAANLIFLMPLLGVGAFVFGPVLNTYISEMVKGHQVATTIGFCNGIWQLGSLLSPVAVGGLLDYSGNYQWVFAMLAAGPLLAVVFLALIRNK